MASAIEHQDLLEIGWEGLEAPAVSFTPRNNLFYLIPQDAYQTSELGTKAHFTEEAKNTNVNRVVTFTSWLLERQEFLCPD